MSAKLHLAENPLALHLLFQRLEGLVDVVVADENLNQRSLSCCRFPPGPLYPLIRGGGERTKRLGPEGLRPAGLSAARYQNRRTMSTPHGVLIWVRVAR